MWAGAVEEGERALHDLLGAARPVVNLFGEMPYAELQSMIDDPPGKRNWWTAEYLADLPDAAVAAFCAYSGRHAGPELHAVAAGPVGRRGGAQRRRDAADEPRRRLGVHPFCVWEGADRDEEHIAWGRGVREAFAPWKTGATYLNFIGDEGPDRVRAAFGADYDRLATVKASWDPGQRVPGQPEHRPGGGTRLLARPPRHLGGARSPAGGRRRRAARRRRSRPR